MRYRRVTEVDAIQFKGRENKDEVINFCREAIPEGTYISLHNFFSFPIITPEGTVEVFLGYYIIRTMDGKYYTCDKNIFEENFEQVEDKTE